MQAIMQRRFENIYKEMFVKNNDAFRTDTSVRLFIYK